ncbi:YbjQ family protein [Verrucomicrobiota bacterium]
MKTLQQIGSLAFVIGFFTSLFAGIPWYVVAVEDPVTPWWLRIAAFLLIGGMLLVLLTLAKEQSQAGLPEPEPGESTPDILLLNTCTIPNREIIDSLGLVRGHTVFAIWLGKDLSALVRLILGGELKEYTQMMNRARETATRRMIEQATEMGADAIVNVRYMTTSVIGSAAELLAYGTAVKIIK